ncbi:MAG TPA: ABC transporter permease subunit [Oleiagrimonas sp.]|nr:ABC transporter permease subunit [Oleiagrimonas sp.]
MMQLAAFTWLASLPYEFPGPEIPLPRWVNTAQRWSAEHLSFLTTPLSDFVKDQVFAGMNAGLEWVWPPVLMIIVAAFAYFASGRRWVLPIGSVIGMLLLWNLGLWDATIQTFSLVLLATVVAVAIGLPVGIASALSPTTRKIITPILDFMQTMPAFVYLLPAIPFFGLGAFSAIIATVVFSTPPCVRLITLGILQVPEDLIEAADSFGSTRRQKLFKVQLPMAMPTIMAGVNQTIMLSLSMVVIAAMISAPGLGQKVWLAISMNNTGRGITSGLAIVILAIILDRMTQRLGRRKHDDK